MSARLSVAPLIALAGLATAAPLRAQEGDDPPDPAEILVSRLTLDRYKATLRGLTRFGDRRQGTERNRDAVDWIETWLHDAGCLDTGRIAYTYPPPPPPDAGERRGPPRGRGRPPAAADDPTTPTGGAVGRRGPGAGGSTIFGYRGPTGVNRDLEAQPDERIRALNVEEPVDGDREEVYCTVVGDTHPEEMYIIGAHMDGHGVNEAVNDDGSGTALVMELARVFSAPDVHTERSIRFVLWNNEETGLNGSRAYVEQRRDLQGIEDPAGSGRYPEPRWLGMVQHDMMLWDHGAPDVEGNVPGTQRPEADVNIEFQIDSRMAPESMTLAFEFKAANERYATDYPAAVGPHMTNTDSAPFQDLVPAISLRENERGAQIGAGWDPNWHQPTDVWTTYTDDDFRLGLNAGQTTLAAIARLAGATIEP